MLIRTVNPNFPRGISGGQTVGSNLPARTEPGRLRQFIPLVG
jgi:hypothetical protein